MILYAISDRLATPGRDLRQWAAECVEAGVDWLQIREKDLDAGELLSIAKDIKAARSGERVLINERTDVALAAGLDGVHLPSDSIGAAACKKLLPKGVAGVSCHSLEEAMTAAEAGADFVVFGPVFDTASKRDFGPPQGLPALAGVCRSVEIPVVALGGVNAANAAACAEAGAAGVAGISLFIRARENRRLIEELRRL